MSTLVLDWTTNSGRQWADVCAGGLIDEEPLTHKILYWTQVDIVRDFV